jgi:hypothetical protein
MVSKIITINDEKYTLVDSPKHKIVKKIKSEQNKLVSCLFIQHKDTIEEYRKENKDATIEDIVGYLYTVNPDEVIQYNESCEDLAITSVISLATNKIWVADEFDDLTEKELMDIYNKCETAIGGNLQDFLEDSQIISVSKSKKPLKTQKS